MYDNTMLMAIAPAAYHKQQWDVLERIFAHPFAHIREGATGLVDLWHRKKARQLSESRGVPVNDTLL